MSGTYITFVLQDRSPGKITDTWEVVSKESGLPVGEIAWFTRWRKYCFYPAYGTVFEEVCLRDISQFIVQQTARHKAERKAA